MSQPKNLKPSSALDPAGSVLLPPVKARRRKKKEGVPALARALAEARVTAGMTQEELARDVGVGLNSLRKIEQGDLRVNLSTLMKIVGYLDSELTIVPKRLGSRGIGNG